MHSRDHADEWQKGWDNEIEQSPSHPPLSPPAAPSPRGPSAIVFSMLCSSTTGPESRPSAPFYMRMTADVRLHKTTSGSSSNALASFLF